MFDMCFSSNCFSFFFFLSGGTRTESLRGFGNVSMAKGYLSRSLVSLGSTKVQADKG